MPASPYVCDAIVTDIEGTTGSIAFVRDILFPYAHAEIAGFVNARQNDPVIASLLCEVAVLAGEPDASLERTVTLLRGWMDEDRKATPLKTLQGLIWAQGYAAGVLRGHVYPDAAAGLRRWRAAGLRLYVYSSGSIAAQKLLFGHSDVGDLTPLFSGYFDTTIGAKGEVASYHRISVSLGIPPATLLFLSDREVELDAAHAADWQVACIARPLDASPEVTSRFRTFASFDEIDVTRK